MAANLNEILEKVRVSYQAKQTQRKESKAVQHKSKGLLAHRTTEKPPFFAWVESERERDGRFSRCQKQTAEYSAMNEEQRLKSLQNGKTAKLKVFQQEVRQRVSELERLKRLNQLDKSYEAVVNEQNVIYQSCFPKKLTTTKKDTCLYHESKYSSFQVGIPGSCKYDYSIINDPCEVNVVSNLLEKQVKKVQTCTSHARKALGSQMIHVDTEKLTELPGGIWNHAKTDVQDEGINHVSRIASSGIIDMVSAHNNVRTASENDCLTGAVLYNDDMHQEQEKGAISSEVELPSENLVKTNNLTFQKSKTAEVITETRKTKEHSKKQVEKQLAVYRRLFMDIEREQVRENIRMKEHRKKMTKLKNIQEITRKKVECEMNEILDERHVIRTQKMILEKQINEEHGDKAAVKENKKFQKEKELERYVDALRATLKERFSNRNIEIPPLCCCGSTIFDTNPETCANNCIFYKNTKGYIKSLTSLLASTDLDL